MQKHLQKTWCMLEGQFVLLHLPLKKFYVKVDKIFFCSAIIKLQRCYDCQHFIHFFWHRDYGIIRYYVFHLEASKMLGSLKAARFNDSRKVIIRLVSLFIWCQLPFILIKLQRCLTVNLFAHLEMRLLCVKESQWCHNQSRLHAALLPMFRLSQSSFECTLSAP